MKFDGYRVQAHFAQGRALMFTRGGYDWAQHFSSLAAALTALPVNGIVLDAEAIPQNEKGIAGFGLLQDDLGRCGGRTVVTDNRIRSCKILAF